MITYYLFYVDENVVKFKSQKTKKNALRWLFLPAQLAEGCQA